MKILICEFLFSQYHDYSYQKKFLSINLAGKFLSNNYGDNC